MSPRELPPPVHPQSSRVAAVVYVVCGAIGVAGLFAAVNDVASHEDVSVVAVAVADADADARAAVGVYRGDGAVVVLDATGHGSRCIGGVPATFGWRLSGNDVVDDAGGLIGTLVGPTLQVGALTLRQPGRGAL